MPETGRPLTYQTADEIQFLVDKYFKDCEGVMLLDSNGDIVRDKYDYPIMIGQKPPTITGLALALGFNSRQSLLNYQEREEFVDTITRAKTRVEAYTEARLFDKEGSNGAKFSLTNNFKNWSEKQDINVNISEEISVLSPEERQAKIAALQQKLLNP